MKNLFYVLVFTALTYSGSGFAVTDAEFKALKNIVVIQQAQVTFLKNRKVKWQRKVLTAPLAKGTQRQLSELQFDNLEVGKTYRVSGSINALRTTPNSEYKSFYLQFNHKKGDQNHVHRDGSYFFVSKAIVSPSEFLDYRTFSTVITAKSKNLFVYVNIGANVEVPATFGDNNFVVVEELSNHVETNEW